MAPSRESVQDDWLATFSDAQLEQLVAEAIQYNSDLRAAAARAEQAAAYVRAAGGSSGRQSQGLRVAAARCPATIWAGGMAGQRPGNSTSGDASATEASAEGAVRSTEADSMFARQSLAALVQNPRPWRPRPCCSRNLLRSAVDAAAKLSSSPRRGFGSASAMNSTWRRARDSPSLSGQASPSVSSQE